MAGSVPAFRLNLFDGFVLTTGSGKPVPLPGRKDRLLLAYLALQAGQPQRRERLYGLLWADRGEQQARGSLRQSLAAIREALGEQAVHYIKADRDTVAFDPSAFEVDVLEFCRLASGPASMGKAMSLYHGELLADVDSPTAEFEQWLRSERQKLETLAAETIEKTALAGDADAASPAIDLGRQLLARDRLREPLYRALMRLHILKLDRTGALKLFADCRSALKEELDTEPEIETDQLYRDILIPRSTKEANKPDPDAGGGERPRLAVLPFSNIGNDPELAVLCDGLAEDVIIGLGRFRLLFVVDRYSSHAVSQLTGDAAEIGKRLNVSLLVQGSLRRRGELIRISVQLVEAATRAQLWGETFDTAPDDVLSVPDAVTRAIVVKLQANVENSIVERGRRKPTLAAYECVLQGIKHLQGYGPDDNQRAIDLFQRATELDPTYALAHAYRGFADIVKHGYGDSPPDIRASSRAMVEKAIEMDPNDARCHWLLGLTACHTGDFEAEERHYLKSLSLNPNDPTLLMLLGATESLNGHADEGIARIREAMRLNPYHPDWYWSDLGLLLYALGRYGDALEAFGRLPRPRPWLLARIAACYGQLGIKDKARKAVEDVLRLDPDFSIATERASGWGASIAAGLAEGMRKAGIPE